MWLGIVPEYTSQFVILSLIVALLYALSSCVTTAIQATGHVKWFQIGIAVILLSELPIAWLLMEKKFPPYAVMWPTLITYSIAIVFRFWLLQRYVNGYKFNDYMVQVVVPCLLIGIVCYMLSYWACCGLERTFLSMILSIAMCEVISISVVYGIGLNKRERAFITARMKNVKSRILLKI